MSSHASWSMGEGDALTPDLTALKLLGGGPGHEAYLAFDEITYAPVVAKMVRPDQVTSGSALNSLRREQAMLERVNHPGVVRLLRGGVEDEERPHLVLEHIEGPRLSSLVRRHGPLQPQQYVPLAVDLASALHYFAHVDVVHLDIKPSNVIMGSPARMIDLSVARPSADAAQITSQIGTTGYMAPEQLAPGERGVPCPASDVWGLGITLHHAITGEKAFRGIEDASALPQAPSLHGRAPAPVADVIAACLDHDPERRPRPVEVAEALEPVLAALPRPKLTFKVRV